MSIRNLGDWSPLGRGEDPIHADPEQVTAAQKRYEHIATTIDDAVVKLDKVVSAAENALVGKYVEALREEATSLRDRLGKAATRYHDVTVEIAKYEPDLDQGLDESARALDDARAAESAQASADAMPDPARGKDGNIPPEEQAKGQAKDRASGEADSDMSAARNRLQSAMDALDVAGKRFGDAVTARRYTDGLTDTSPWRLNEILKKIAKALAIVGLILAGFALLIPGVNAIVIAGLAVGVASLAVSSVLYHNGEGSLVDVILGSVGLSLAGAGVIASQFGKQIGNAARGLGGRGRPGGVDNIQLRPMGGAGGGGAGAGAGVPRPVSPASGVGAGAGAGVPRPVSPASGVGAGAGAGVPRPVSPASGVGAGAGAPRPVSPASADDVFVTPPSTPRPGSAASADDVFVTPPSTPRPGSPTGDAPVPGSLPGSRPPTPPGAPATPPPGAPPPGAPATPPAVPTTPPGVPGSVGSVGGPGSIGSGASGIPQNAATEWRAMSDWFNNPATNALLGKGGFVTPEVGFWASNGEQFRKGIEGLGNLGTLNGAKDFGRGFIGIQSADDLANVAGSVGQTISPGWYAFGAGSRVFDLGAIGYTGGRLDGKIPSVPGPFGPAVKT